MGVVIGQWGSCLVVRRTDDCPRVAGSNPEIGAGRVLGSSVRMPAELAELAGCQRLPAVASGCQRLPAVASGCDLVHDAGTVLWGGNGQSRGTKKRWDKRDSSCPVRGSPLDSGSGTKQVLGAGGRAKGCSPPPGRSRGAPSRRAAGPWGPGPIWSRVSEVLSWTSSVSESVAKRPKSMCTKVSIHSSSNAAFKCGELISTRDRLAPTFLKFAPMCTRHPHI